MLKLFVLFVVTAAAIADPLRNNLRRKHNARIWGGNNAVIEDFPYQVNFLLAGKLKDCGGAIISHKWVLTSASCSVETGEKLRTGSSFKYKGGTLHTVVRVIRHEDFQVSGLSVNDIALVEVEEPFIFDKTRQPIPLFNIGEQVEAYSLGKVAGFGATENEDNPTNLSSISIPIIPKDECYEIYNPTNEFHEGQFCAGYAEGKFGACFGDTGSPFVVNGRVAGLVATDYGCAVPGYPDIYTNIADYRSWIDVKLLAK